MECAWQEDKISHTKHMFTICAFRCFGRVRSDPHYVLPSTWIYTLPDASYYTFCSMKTSLLGQGYKCHFHNKYLIHSNQNLFRVNKGVVRHTSLTFAMQITPGLTIEASVYSNPTRHMSIEFCWFCSKRGFTYAWWVQMTDFKMILFTVAILY